MRMLLLGVGLEVARRREALDEPPLRIRRRPRGRPLSPDEPACAP